MLSEVENFISLSSKMDVEDLIVEIYRLLVVRANAKPEVQKAIAEHPIMKEAIEVVDNLEEFTDCNTLD